MTATAGSPERSRILFVDDDPDTRELMRLLLNLYGYEVVIATSLNNALECAKSGGIDLCILDHWITKRSDGLNLCRQIRAFDSDTPIVFYSGAAYQIDIQAGLNAGAQAYLVKPDFDHLHEAIDRLIERPTVH